MTDFVASRSPDEEYWPTVRLPDGWRDVRIESIHGGIDQRESCGHGVWFATVTEPDGGERPAWIESLFADPIQEHTPERCRSLRERS